MREKGERGEQQLRGQNTSRAHVLSSCAVAQQVRGAHSERNSYTITRASHAQVTCSATQLQGTHRRCEGRFRRLRHKHAHSQCAPRTMVTQWGPRPPADSHHGVAAALKRGALTCELACITTRAPSSCRSCQLSRSFLACRPAWCSSDAAFHSRRPTPAASHCFLVRVWPVAMASSAPSASPPPAEAGSAVAAAAAASGEKDKATSSSSSSNKRSDKEDDLVSFENIEEIKVKYAKVRHRQIQACNRATPCTADFSLASSRS